MYVQFNFWLCYDVCDQTTTLICRFDEQSIMLCYVMLCYVTSEVCEKNPNQHPRHQWKLWTTKNEWHTEAIFAVSSGRRMDRRLVGRQQETSEISPKHYVIPINDEAHGDIRLKDAEEKFTPSVASNLTYSGWILTKFEKIS